MISRSNRRGAETQSTFRNCLLAIVFLFCAFAPLREIHAQSLSPATQKQIEAILSDPSLKEAHVGVSILDLGTVEDKSTFPAKPHVGKPYRVLFERDAQKKFMPASNMKLFTAAIVLKLLGKEKTFPTTVLKTPPDRYFSYDTFLLVGGGDPSLDDTGLAELAQKVRATGENTIFRLFGASSAFGAETYEARYPFGWTLDDMIWYYGAPIRALSVNRNQFDLIIKGGEKPGDRASCSTSPDVGPKVCGVITGDWALSKKSDEELIQVTSRTDIEAFPEVIVKGSVAPKQVVVLGLAVKDPSSWGARQFKQQLNKLYVNVVGLTRQNPPDMPRNPPQELKGELIANHNSPPLKVLFQRFLKNSDNLYAEMLLRNVAYYFDGTGGDKAGPRAHELLKKWLVDQGIDTTPLRFEDGSGLSRYNLLTPRSTAQLLASINGMKDGDVIWDALPIAGVDGTLRSRMKSNFAANNVRAKTGTFSIASNLSGYVTTRDNRRLAVALYINFARDTKTAQTAQDKVFAALAGSSLHHVSVH